jgi:hypothetical protein
VSQPLPPWRIHSEEGPQLIIEVDLPDMEHAYITVMENQFDTPLMEEMIRSAVAHRARTIGDVNAGGG